MTALSTLSISSSGLSSYEEGLLVQQLKMLRGHTKMQWVYAGTDNGAALHIERAANSAVDIAAAVLGSADGSPPLVKRIEMPLRVFGLIELLQECEARLADLVTPQTTPAPTFSSRLAALPPTGIAYVVQAQAVVVVSDDQVLSRAASFEQLLALVQAAAVDSEIRIIAGAPGLNQLPHYYGFKRLLWALTLAEPATAGHFAPDSEFKIGAWPLFSEWHSSPLLLRLAALFSRQFSSVEQAAQFAQTEPHTVRAFLLACERCGLGIVSRRTTPAATPAPAPAVGQNLLQRLRSRLGLGYRT